MKHDVAPADVEGEDRMSIYIWAFIQFKVQGRGFARQKIKMLSESESTPFHGVPLVLPTGIGVK